MLSEKEVQHIAALARIGLTKKEILKYQKDLSSILDYFEKIKELNTEKVETIEHITGRFNSLREDKQNDFDDLERKEIIKLFPESKNGYDKVKSVLK